MRRPCRTPPRRRDRLRSGTSVSCFDAPSYISLHCSEHHASYNNYQPFCFNVPKSGRGRIRNTFFPTNLFVPHETKIKTGQRLLFVCPGFFLRSTEGIFLTLCYVSTVFHAVFVTTQHFRNVVIRSCQKDLHPISFKKLYHRNT